MATPVSWSSLSMLAVNKIREVFDGLCTHRLIGLSYDEGFVVTSDSWPHNRGGTTCTHTHTHTHTHTQGKCRTVVLFNRSPMEPSHTVLLVHRPMLQALWPLTRVMMGMFWTSLTEVLRLGLVWMMVAWECSLARLHLVSVSSTPPPAPQLVDVAIEKS